MNTKRPTTGLRSRARSRKDEPTHDSQPLIDGFCDYLEATRGFSAHTARCYATDIAQFDAYLSNARVESPQGRSPLPPRSAQAQVPPAPNGTARTGAMLDTLLSAHAEDVRGFLGLLDDRGYSKASAVRKLAALRSFYRYCLRRRLRTDNPVAEIESPKPLRRPPRCVSPEDMARLLNTPDERTVLGARDRAIFEMLYSTGIRVGELVSLRRSDIDIRAERVHLRRPGCQRRCATIGPSALGAICRYLQLRDAAKGVARATCDRLFVNRSGGPLSTRSVRRKLGRYLAQAGMDPAINPRMIRHSFAALLLDSGAELGDVQSLLGHQSIATTQVYRLRDACGDEGQSGGAGAWGKSRRHA